MQTDLTSDPVATPSFRTAFVGFVMSVAMMTSVMVLLGTMGA